MNNPPSKYSDGELYLAWKMQYLCTVGSYKAYIIELKGELAAFNYNIDRNPNITHGGHQFKWMVEEIKEIDKLRETKIGQLLCG